MTSAPVRIAAPLARYAERFHDSAGEGHHVASPLGAWLLLALAGPASDGSARTALSDALGVDVDVASAIAADLLTTPHPVVSSATAVWTVPAAATEALGRWIAGLPDTVEVGDLPDQAGADEWARRHTAGLIKKFPLDMTADTVLVLASALAAMLTWKEPYDVVPAARLGAESPWANDISTALATPQVAGFRQFIARTDRAGDVGVHVASGEGGQLRVISVVAAEDVAAHDVLAAAHRIATAVTDGDPPVRSLFDLPLGDGPVWTIGEEPIPPGGDHRTEVCRAVLPAWTAESEHDLTRVRALGFPAAADTLAGLMDLAAFDHEARQSALARYTRVGFEAAAVTALGIRLSAARPRTGVRRRAELRFGHPYAVVAVTDDERYDDGAGTVLRGPWHGVPVFSAWVAEPRNAADASDE